MLHTSFIELDQEALNCNIEFLKSIVPDQTRFSMVV